MIRLAGALPITGSMRRPGLVRAPGLGRLTGVLMLMLASLLAACAGPGSRAPAPISSSTSSAPSAPATPSAAGAPGASSLPPGSTTTPGTPPATGAPPPLASVPRDSTAPASRRPGPIAERRIDVQGRCAQTEEDGFREDATLMVRDNQVQALSWQLWVGRRGSCRFEHADFQQVRSRPHIELHARDGSGCKLMVWQDPRRITLAHADCQRRCNGGIYEQAWPVMFDPASGACAKTDR